MLEIHRGTSRIIEYYIYDKYGNLSNADGNVSLTIYDMNSASTLLTGETATNDPKLGLYTYNLSSLYTGTDTTLRITWNYSINSLSQSQEQFISIVTPYATVSDIISFNNYGARPQDPNYKSEEQIVYAEQIARMQINNYTSLNFGKRYDSQEIFAIGSDAVELTERMISVDKVYGNGVLIIDYTVNPIYNLAGWDVEITPTGKAIRIINNGWDVRYDNQVDPTVLYYGTFRRNERYKFTGYIGYEYVPQDIKLCTMILAGDLLSQDAAWRNKYLTQIRLSETQFTLGKGAFNGTGNVIVDSILDSYRNTNIVVI
ncbi:MAG: hypothetical protein EB127_01855 [Alphaproteobacteria bacterium]|nr:hypothetical protein [Alphaproteobacteria bacterium]